MPISALPAIAQCRSKGPFCFRCSERARRFSATSVRKPGTLAHPMGHHYSRRWDQACGARSATLSRTSAEASDRSPLFHEADLKRCKLTSRGHRCTVHPRNTVRGFASIKSGQRSKPQRHGTCLRLKGSFQNENYSAMLALLMLALPLPVSVVRGASVYPPQDIHNLVGAHTLLPTGKNL